MVLMVSVVSRFVVSSVNQLDRSRVVTHIILK